MPVMYLLLVKNILEEWEVHKWYLFFRNSPIFELTISTLDDSWRETKASTDISLPFDVTILIFLFLDFCDNLSLLLTI